MSRLPMSQRREQLITAAVAVMTRDGIDRATTRAICAEAGVSLSVFHYCFDSKQALLDAVSATLTRRTVAGVSAALRPAEGGTAVESVRAALQHYWDDVVAHPEVHRLAYALTQYVLPRPDLAHLAREQYRRVLAVLGEIVDGYVAGNRARLEVPAPVITHYLATVLDGLTLTYLILGDEAGADQVLDTVADHLLTLVRPG